MGVLRTQLTFQDRQPFQLILVLTVGPAEFMQDPPVRAFLFPAIPAPAALLLLSPKVPAGDAPQNS